MGGELPHGVVPVFGAKARQFRIEREGQQLRGLGHRVGHLPADTPERRRRGPDEAADHQRHEVGEGDVEGS